MRVVLEAPREGDDRHRGGTHAHAENMRRGGRSGAGSPVLVAAEGGRVPRTGRRRLAGGRPDRATASHASRRRGVGDALRRVWLEAGTVGDRAQAAHRAMRGAPRHASGQRLGGRVQFLCPGGASP